jgi:hypothetical protein
MKEREEFGTKYLLQKKKNEIKERGERGERMEVLRARWANSLKPVPAIAKDE